MHDSARFPHAFERNVEPALDALFAVDDNGVSSLPGQSSEEEDLTLSESDSDIGGEVSNTDEADGARISLISIVFFLVSTFLALAEGCFLTAGF